MRTLADVHGRYWDCEARTTLYCELLDAVPAAAEPAAALLASKGSAEFVESSGVASGEGALDLALLELVLGVLDPAHASQTWSTAEDYGPPSPNQTASWSVRRALLTPQGNPGSRSRCGARS